MGSDFKKELEGAAGEFGIKANRPAKDEEARPVKAAETKTEIKEGDLVNLNSKKGLSIFRLPGGKPVTDLSSLNSMGYKDDQRGFTVESLQPYNMVEIKPVKYTYRNQTGQTYLVPRENVSAIEARKYSI